MEPFRSLIAPCAVLLGMAALPGCALDTAYTRPAVPLAATFPDSGTAPSSVATRGLGWAKFFGDAHLRALIATAIANNRDLLRAVRRVAEARALYGIQRADQLPTIAAAASANRGRTPADLSLTGRAAVAGQYQAGLGISNWELDLWGRIDSLTESARESYLATEATRRAVLVSLVAQVANAYLFERELDERLAIAEKTLASREESQRIAQRRYAVGATSRLDAAQAEILLNQARAEWAALQRLRAQARNALTLLAGVPLADAEAVPLSRIESGFLVELVPGLPSETLLERPDIRAAEHRLKAAHASIVAARAAFFPRIALTGSLGSASAELEGLFAAGSRAWSFLPALTLPLFDAGRNRAGLDLAEARRDIAVADYERTVQGAFREVADALAERRWLSEQLITQKGALAAHHERARLARLRYDSGAAAYLEVLDAERERFAAEQALVQTRRALLASGVSLYAALGGGEAVARLEEGNER